MKGWAADNGSKTGWLKWVGDGPAPASGAFNITTDYENIFPEVVTRKVICSLSFSLCVFEDTI